MAEFYHRRKLGRKQNSIIRYQVIIMIGELLTKLGAPVNCYVCKNKMEPNDEVGVIHYYTRSGGDKFICGECIMNAVEEAYNVDWVSDFEGGY